MISPSACGCQVRYAVWVVAGTVAKLLPYIVRRSELKADPERSLRLAEATLEVLRQYAPRAFSRPDELRLMRERLRAVLIRPAAEPERPRSSLHASSLIVNAEGDSLLEHLRSEGRPARGASITDLVTTAPILETSKN